MSAATSPDPSAPTPGAAHATARVGRNALLSGLAQAAPALAALATVPLIIRTFGVDRFGLLVLAWGILGTFAVFDLGMGRAGARSVAAAIREGRGHELPPTLATMLTIQLIIAAAVSAAVALVGPWAVERLLHVPSAYVREAQLAAWILAAAVPVVAVASTLRGVVEGTQRFAAVAAISIPVSLATYLAPLVAGALGGGLPLTVALMVLARAAGAMGFALVALRALPALTTRFRFDRARARDLVTFGGWLTATNVAGTVLTNLDRFLIAGTLAVGALTFYAAPYEIVAKLWLIPSSLALALLPAVSSTSAASHAEEQRLLRFSLKALVLAMAAAVFPLIAFADDGLAWWLGEEFLVSAPLLRIMALGLLVNTLGWVPYSVAIGKGRPDLQFKVVLVQLPILALVGYAMTRTWGIQGMAVAWAISAGLYTVWSYTLIRHALRIPMGAFVDSRTPHAATLLALMLVAAFGIALWDAPLAWRGAAAFVALVAYAVCAWTLAFDGDERDNLKRAAGLTTLDVS